MHYVEIFENERAAGYDQFVGNWIPGYHYFLGLLPKILKGTANKDLLVVGCGTGNEIEQFAQTSGRWEITGIDPSPDMIMLAREKLQGYKNIRLFQGTVPELDTGKIFGAATLLLVLHFLADNGDKLRLLKSIAERLAPGAQFIMLDITGGKDQIKGNLEILKLLLPDGLDEMQIKNRMYRIENELNPIPEERLSALCIEAGFEPPLRFFQSSIYMGWATRKQ